MKLSLHLPAPFRFFAVAILLFVLLGVFKRFVLVVASGEAVLIETLGRCRAIAKPGVHFLNPLLDNGKVLNWSYRTQNQNGGTYIKRLRSCRIPTQEMTFDFPAVTVSSKDQITTSVDGVLFYRIEDPFRAAYCK